MRRQKRRGGPGDELSVTLCDGELCACLPELVRHLRGREKEAREKSAMECYRDFVLALLALEGLGSGRAQKPV